MEHTPAGRDLRLAAGVAFDLTARRVQTGYVTRRDSTAARAYAPSPPPTTASRSRNATDSATTVDVIEERAGEWSVVKSSVPAEKLSTVAPASG